VALSRYIGLAAILALHGLLSIVEDVSALFDLFCFVRRFFWISLIAWRPAEPSLRVLPLLVRQS